MHNLVLILKKRINASHTYYTGRNIKRDKGLSMKRKKDYG